MLALFGLGASFEQVARDFRDGLRSRPASGQIAIIEIDSHSLKQFDRWPWPRSLYGMLLDRLDEAGVDTVAFDIDFSARSDPAEDAALAAAIGRFDGTVILPTFRQKAGSNRSGFDESLPIAPLRERAFLASVNVHPDPDGIIRRYSYGTRTNDVPRPSIGAMLAGARGEVNVQFQIDQAIDPQTIPRMSFGDILSGKQDLSRLVGKRVIVGGTAIELGDRYAVPRHGLLPGVVVQVQAAETLLHGRPPPVLGGWLLLVLVTLMMLAISRIASWKKRGASLVLLSLAVLGLAAILEMRGLVNARVVPAFGLIAAYSFMAAILDILAAITATERKDIRSGLPNSLALVDALKGQEECRIIAVKFPSFAEIAAIFGDAQRAELQNRLADRLFLGASGATIHLDGPGLFVWLDGSGSSRDALADQIEGIAALFRGTLKVGDRAVLLKPHFGIANGFGSSAGDLLAKAVRAAGQAAHDDCLWTLDSAELGARVGDRQSLLADLPVALAKRQFWVAYQPKLDVATGRISGAEALVRWRHPIRGPIAPTDFIPLLEKERQIQDVTLYVLDVVMADLAQFLSSEENINVAVNISSSLLLDPAFNAAVLSRLDASAGMARHLTFEVTESATISNPEEAIRVLAEYASRGVRISIDDYGTGQATLSYIRSFPAYEIKIDKSFIQGMLSSQGDRILVRSTIELAHELGFKVVAEGVETVECLSLLRSFECDVVQGWHISRPLPLDDFHACLVTTLMAA